MPAKPAPTTMASNSGMAGDGFASGMGGRSFRNGRAASLGCPCPSSRWFRAWFAGPAAFGKRALASAREGDMIGRGGRTPLRTGKGEKAMPEEDPRVLYAADRTVLAAERTYAAWVRTGLVSLVAGVGAKTSLGSVLPEWAILFNATLLVLFSAFCFGVAVWRDLKPGTILRNGPTCGGCRAWC
jgi:hypothetical protein